MADNKIQIKRTSVSGRTPNTTNSGNTQFIDTGELALNLTDGKLFSSNGTSLFEVGANLSSVSIGTQPTVVNSSGIYVSNSSSENSALTTEKLTFGKGIFGNSEFSADTLRLIANSFSSIDEASLAANNDGPTLKLSSNGTSNTYILISLPSALIGSNSGIIVGNTTNNTKIRTTAENIDLQKDNYQLLVNAVSLAFIDNANTQTLINANTIQIKSITANGSTGSSGDVLASNGTGIYWSNAASSGLKGDKGEVGVTGDKGDKGETGAGLTAGSNNQILYRDSSNVVAGSSGLLYDGSAVKVNGRVESLYSNGDEGGELYLNKPATNTSIADGIVIDIYQNKIRFFESGGTNRGAFIDFTAAGTGVGSNLLAGGGGGANVTLTSNTSDTQSFFFPMSNTSTGSWSNAVVDTDLSFVPSASTLALGNTTVNTQVNASSIRTTSFIDNNGNKLIIRDSSNNIVWGG